MSDTMPPDPVSPYKTAPGVSSPSPPPDVKDKLDEAALRARGELAADTETKEDDSGLVAKGKKSLALTRKSLRSTGMHTEATA